MRTLAFSVLSLTLVALSAPASASADCVHAGCGQKPISGREAGERLNDLLASEGLATTRAGLPIVQPIELDGDSSTVEAIITVVSAENCVAGACDSVIVRRDCTGSLVTIGHGTWVTPLASRSSGWLDLSSASFGLVPARALKFADGRYS